MNIKDIIENIKKDDTFKMIFSLFENKNKVEKNPNKQISEYNKQQKINDLYICTQCGTTITKWEYDNNKQVGLGCMQLLLWFIFSIITGGIGFIIFLIVIIIDHNKAKSGNNKIFCKDCNAKNSFVKVSTPVGKELYNKYYSKEQ